MFKLLFFRGKDLNDLERLVALHPVDAAWVRARILEMLGDDDARVVSWDAITRP